MAVYKVGAEDFGGWRSNQVTTNLILIKDSVLSNQATIEIRHQITCDNRIIVDAATSANIDHNTNAKVEDGQ
jgi:hypothetical protein